MALSLLDCDFAHYTVQYNHPYNTAHWQHISSSLGTTHTGTGTLLLLKKYTNRNRVIVRQYTQNSDTNDA